MKKFYAIAALLCGSFMAASAVTVAALPEIKSRVSELSVNNQTTFNVKNIQKMESTNRVMRAPKKADAKDGGLTTYDLEGIFADWGKIQLGRDVFFGTGGTTRIKALSDTELEFTGFFSGMSSSVMKGTFNPADSTVLIPWQQPFDLKFSDGSSVECVVYAANGDEEVVTPQDIVLKYIDERLGLGFIEDNQYLTLGQNDPTKWGYGYEFCDELYLCAYNAIMKYCPEEPAATVDDLVASPIYMEINNNNTLSVYNIYDYGFMLPVNLVIEPAAAAVYCENQIVIGYNNLLNAELKPLIKDINSIVGVIMNNDGQSFMFNTEELEYQDGGTYTAIYHDDVIGVVYPNLEQRMDLYYNTMLFWEEGSIFDAAEAGVKNIDVDNSNAPVEYFNLQGVRIANPENGLFIRRQGSDVKKVIVK